MLFRDIKLIHSDKALVQSWQTLIHWIRTRIEHMILMNDSGDTILAGQVLYFSGHRGASLADALCANAEFIGVAEETSEGGESFVACNDNVARVLVKDGEDPQPNNVLYVSDTAGYASTVQPASPTCDTIIGRVWDNSSYVTDGSCLVLLHKCCADPVQ